jgi:hypothetical protein
MSQRISSFPIGTIYYQSGYGVPTHIATKGCTYIDIDTGTMYINKDGIIDWGEFLDNPSGFTILSNLSTLNAVDDSGAAGLGVPLYGLYRNGNVVQIRIV